MWHKGLERGQIAGALTLGTPLWEPLPVGGGETKSLCPSSSNPSELWVNHNCHLSHWAWGGYEAKWTEHGLWGQADLAVNPGSTTQELYHLGNVHEHL